MNEDPVPHEFPAPRKWSIRSARVGEFPAPPDWPALDCQERSSDQGAVCEMWSATGGDVGLFALIAERPPLTNARKPQHSRRYLRRTLSGRDLCAGPADRRGTMLCLAGLGALAGVPVIILVILSPLIGPTLGIKVVRGPVHRAAQRSAALARSTPSFVDPARTKFRSSVANCCRHERQRCRTIAELHNSRTGSLRLVKMLPDALGRLTGNDRGQ